MVINVHMANVIENYIHILNHDTFLIKVLLCCVFSALFNKYEQYIPKFVSLSQFPRQKVKQQ